MIRRILCGLMLVLTCATSVMAVLKERDLPRTLSVLKAELQDHYERQQSFMSMYEQRGARQHQMLVNYMQQCEQISLMLYSQSSENSFDMAYACQQATNLAQDLKKRNSRMHQYDKIIAQMQSEIERYDALIQSLKSMPPVSAKDADSVLSVYDSILIQAIDSLAEKADSLKAVKDSMPDSQPHHLSQHEPPSHQDSDTSHPLFLSGQELQDREECLKYAQIIRDNMQRFLDNLEAENTYYQSVTAKVAEINAFAQERYKMLQSNIFRNGDENYLDILSHFRMYLMRARMSIHQKYMPFPGHDITFSEWRGATVLFISVFLIFYLSLALLLSYALLRWVLPRKWRGSDFKLRLRMLNNVVGIALFAIIVMIVRATSDRNFIQMGTGLIINMAWLLEAIFLSLYIRLRGEEMRHAAIIYMPLMFTAFLVILIRIVLIPNVVVNLLLPPLMLALCIWQLVVSRRHRRHLPVLDMVYTYLTTTAMVVCTVASWVGYTLLAVQILVWWTFQLAAIMTITCLYDLMNMYCRRVLIKRVSALQTSDGLPAHLSEEQEKSLLQSVRRGDFITTTWLYDFLYRTLLPILGVSSVLLSFYWASEIFEMTSICEKVFMTDFIKSSNLVRLSLYRICLVAGLWFVFRFLNYSIRAFYTHTRRTIIATGQNLNVTLARNVIAILCWGTYILIALAILEVPKSGISIVGAGLATGLGFAMQSILENFFYGINLMAGRVHVGDYIECDGIAGKVESITYQSTQIVTADGSVIAFLNSALFSKNFKNMTRNHRFELVKIPVGVAYGSNVQQVRQMLVEAIQPLCEQTDAEGRSVARTDVPISVVFSDFGDSSVDLLVCIWMRVEDKIALTARVRETIYETLTHNGVEIPFPQCDVHMRG
ncbi:MAG: mechanosensitive ion channel [Bacteroidaceae bacterium]|nr:mechanosensitive ion channel [Paraprevotella sp.]MDY4614385.1 mechanosensitive ion channel [Bacteroidaceae bacterium]MDY4744799.1 mechanosensitive ion channel [Bacteroidaceae bacterium]MDY5962888.1 mechanosensitive ion channel [Bacteroidaceae bacterium]